MSGAARALFAQLSELLARVLPDLTAFKPLAQRLAEWVKISQSGKLAVGLIAALFARPLVYSAWRRVKGYPPGSIGFIPFLSNYLVIGAAKAEWLLSQKEQYGRMSMHWFGNKGVVYLNDLDLVRQTFRDRGMVRRFSDLDDASQLAVMAKAEKYIGTAAFPLLDGEVHMKRRNLMRDNCIKLVNSEHLNECIAKWMTDTLYPTLDNLVAKSTGECLWSSLYSDITYGFTSVLCWTCFGLKMNITVDEAARFSDLIHPRFKHLGPVFAMRSLPAWLMPTVMKYGVHPDYTKSHGQCKEMLVNWIHDFRQSEDFLTTKEKPLFANTMLMEVQKEDPLLNYEQALSDMNNLFEGGTHTTVSNICVGIYNLVRYPLIQQELYEELIREFPDGVESLEVNKLRKQCPKLRAFVWESLRLSILPMHTGPRFVSEDFTLGGYTIPRGCSLLCNSVSIDRDCELWGPDAAQFKIERWLNSDDGSFNTRMIERMAIFSLGRRDCPGKAVALNELCMIDAYLLLRYKLTMPADSEEVPMIHWGQQLDFFPKIEPRFGDK